MDYKEKYLSWINNPNIDEITKEELRKIENDDNEIKERFALDLAFGTAGLRGILGAGTNRMNVYIVRRATQGLANYILSLGEKYAKMGVAIAYDSRHMSAEFATESANVLAANNIRVYLYSALRPTPMLSFAVREKGAIAGITITASHNPSQYNGYKVYWSDGGQLPPAEASVVEKCINELDITEGIKYIPNDTSYIEFLNEDFDDVYIRKVMEQSLNKELVKSVADDFHIVYTPLHGSGNIPVRKALKELGVKNVHIVKEQEMPDGSFPTVKTPNPEDKSCFPLAIDLANKVKADLIIGTDPDCDRMGIMVRAKTGEFVPLSGNEVGVLLIDYILSEKKNRGILPGNAAIIKSIVSTKMADAVVKHYGATMCDVLTGFKFIGEKIKEYEQSGEHTFMFGFEESYGYLSGTYVRDKDAVVASMLIAECAALYKTKGMTLYDAMEALYEKFGYYKNSLKSITLGGISGMKKIAEIMDYFRKTELGEIAGRSIVSVSDYKTSEKYNLIACKTEKIMLPPSDVLVYELEDGSFVTLRPSGTEPKIKIYYSATGISAKEAGATIDVLNGAFSKMIDSLC